MVLMLLYIFGWFTLQDTFARPSNNPKVALAERMNQQGLYRIALNSLDDVIEKGLGDSDVYAFRGTVLGMRGTYHDAMADFQMGLDSPRLNGRDGESHAFVQFVHGDCTAPEYLEQLRLFGQMPKAAGIRLLSTEVEMHRYCGNRIGAYNAQSQMTAEFPRAVKTHLAAADLALDEGNVEEAWRHLFNSQIYYRYVGVLDILARIALVEERYESAFQTLQYIKAQRVSDRSMILKGLATLMAGDPSVWLYKMSKPRWVDNENPHLIYLKLWAMQELGLQRDLQQEMEWFRLFCDTTCSTQVERNLELELQSTLPFSLTD